VEIKNRQKTLVIAVAVIAGLYIVQSAVYSPLKSLWEARDKQINKLKDAVLADEHLINKRPEILKRWKFMQENALTNDLSQANSTLRKALDSWQNRSGVGTESGATQLKQDTDETSSDIINTLECRVDATGNITSLLNFLWAIENEKMGLKLDNVEIAAKDNAGQQLTMGLTISALILDQTPQSGPAKKTASEETP
jgi:hypothetical protein